MLCNNGKNIVNLSDKEYRSCYLSKCGGWKFVQSGCSTKKFGCTGSAGAWLPAVSVCNQGLYTPIAKSSSSSSPNIYLENLEQFRSSSVDISLINDFYNKGVNVAEIDLDQLDTASSSTSSGFSLLIYLNHQANQLGESYSFPEDLDFYVYDEKSDGIETPGMISVQKITGENKVLVNLVQGVPNGTSEFSFQLNIEHESISTWRRRLVFRSDREYSYETILSEPIANRPNRLSESYITYLANWINQFWEAYDLNNFSLLEEFVRPYPNAEFDPFTHARWAILNGFATYIANSVSSGPANTGLVAGWNFLGVSPDTWNCIRDAGLYEHYGIDKKNFKDWITGGGKYNDPSFDCRSFTHAAINFLREQLKSSCPNANVYYLGVLEHALVMIDLGGDPSPCCEGTIIYEPQNGNTWDGKDAYCAQYPDSCVVWEYNEDGTGIGTDRDDNPDWEKYPKEVERIKDVICGCLEGKGTYPSNTSEGIIQQKCQDGTFKDWFKENYSFEPGKKSPGNFDLPQVIDCKKCLCLSSRDANTGSPCLEDDQGTFTPYVCSYHCIGKWSCGPNGCYEVFSPGGVLGQYDSKEECELDPECNFGAWCTVELGCDEKFYVSGCDSGSLADWQAGDAMNKVQGFQKDKTCSDISCVVEPLPNCDCVYEWVAEYKCGEGWGFMNVQPYKYCGSPLRPLDQWVVDDVGETPFSGCYRTYTSVSGKCDYSKSCGDVVFPPPSLPSETPECCGAWCSGELGCDGKFYVTGCKSGSIDEWQDDNSQNKAQGFQKGKSCSDISCVVETLPICGAWCTGEIGCDGKFYVIDCNSGTLYDWQADDAQNKAQGFQEGKNCFDITCTAETLPSCGAWCTGEFGCDGKFYVSGCNSGSLYDWQADNDQNKAQGFQEGKSCSDISCPVETLPNCECVYEWVAKYDCDTGWKLVGGGQPYSYCGQPLRPLDQWVVDDVGETPLGSCYRTYTSVSGQCSSVGSCNDLVLPPPSLPSETPSCCGAWCTGELACDGKFYVTGCASGSLSDWQSDNAQNKAQSFQDGKKCSEISCVVETLPDCSSSSSCDNPPICNDRQFVNDNCECECFSPAVNACDPPKVQTGAAFGCECVCPNPPVCNGKQFLNDNCECECFSAADNFCYPPKIQTGPDCDCVCDNPPTCGANQFLNDNCECQCSCPAGECCEKDALDQYVCVPCTKCICDPYSGPIPSSEGTEDCSLCQKTWVCDSQQGPIENPGYWYYGPAWSTTGPTEEQAKETCKETFDCYNGCYGYWTDNYYGQFNTLSECESECVDRYYCQGWSPYGGDPCYLMGKDLYGEKNCDKCQIIGYQCDSTYGKIPVYGDPNAPLPSGLMSETDVCYQVYSCDSYNQCVLQGWATTGDDEASCKMNCTTRAWECNQSTGCQPVYGTSPLSLSPGQYNTESDCNVSCLERYECQQWGCYSVGYNSDPNLPASCAAMDCVERYDCSPSAGCQSVGYGKTGAKSCNELNCEKKYECNESQGCVVIGYGDTVSGYAACDQFECDPRYACDQSGKCVISGYGPSATGAKSCEGLDCYERYLCDQSGQCKVSGYGAYAVGYKTISECEAQCITPTCISVQNNSCGFPQGNCTAIERFTQTISVPEGMTLPVFVTMTGSVDDVLMIDGNVVDAGQTVGMNGCLVGGGNYSFVLTNSSFTIGAGDTVGFCSGYDYTICFHPEIPPGAA